MPYKLSTRTQDQQQTRNFSRSVIGCFATNKSDAMNWLIQCIPVFFTSFVKNKQTHCERKKVGNCTWTFIIPEGDSKKTWHSIRQFNVQVSAILNSFQILPSHLVFWTTLSPQQTKHSFQILPSHLVFWTTLSPQQTCFRANGIPKKRAKEPDEMAIWFSSTAPLE